MLPVIREPHRRSPGPDARQISLLHTDVPEGDEAAKEPADDPNRTALVGLLGETLPESEQGAEEDDEARRAEVQSLLGDDTDK